MKVQNHVELTVELSDDELMVLTRDGDNAAFEQLVRRHEQSLVRFFHYRTRDRQLAEDLAQETFLRVYKEAPDYAADGRFFGWLFQIARNLVVDSFRSQSRNSVLLALRSEDQEQSGFAGLVANIPTPLDVADQNEFSQIVTGMLGELPAEQRMTFTLHHFSGLSLPEVAKTLGASVPTTKGRLRLAKAKMAEKLGNR